MNKNGILIVNQLNSKVVLQTIKRDLFTIIVWSFECRNTSAYTNCIRKSEHLNALSKGDNDRALTSESMLCWHG